LKNYRQRCGPLRAPSGHNFSKAIAQPLLPVIAEQGGAPALRETARAIVDTAKWWP
jgi:hypothetical protein